VQITPTLFGEWALVREWGRRGSPGTMRLSSYERRNEAETAEQRTIKRRLQHGYFQSQPRSSAMQSATAVSCCASSRC
jgi:predicted DNA-binding WGR domain protein